MTKPETKRTVSVEYRGDRGAHMERVFEASLDRVWSAYTEPKLLAQWWGRGNRVTIVTFELKKGGHWRFVEHTDHGDHGFEGRFREVETKKRLAQTFEWDGAPGHVMVNDQTFVDLGGGRTKIVIESKAFEAEDLEAMKSSGMVDGMEASYAALDKLLASL